MRATGLFRAESWLFLIICSILPDSDLTLMSAPLAFLITQETVKLIAGIGAVVLIILAVMRHKSKKKTSEDDDF